jgi:hypothetical protein
MHQDIVALLKAYNKKCNLLDDKVYELQKQYDRVQYELKCVKELLSELCDTAAPHRKEAVERMIENHGRIFRTELSGASIVFEHQLFTDLGPSSPTVWANIL